jgi:ATP-dependent DNA ligase
VPPLSLARRVALGLMHATQVTTPFHREGWVYEEKVDGYRMAAVKTDHAVSLISRNGIDHTKAIPRAVHGTR